jgi:hypothetical protein
MPKNALFPYKTPLKCTFLAKNTKKRVFWSKNGQKSTQKWHFGTPPLNLGVRGPPPGAGTNRRSEDFFSCTRRTHLTGKSPGKFFFRQICAEVPLFNLNNVPSVLKGGVQIRDIFRPPKKGVKKGSKMTPKMAFFEQKVTFLRVLYRKHSVFTVKTL